MQNRGRPPPPPLKTEIVPFLPASHHLPLGSGRKAEKDSSILSFFPSLVRRFDPVAKDQSLTPLHSLPPVQRIVPCFDRSGLKSRTALSLQRTETAVVSGIGLRAFSLILVFVSTPVPSGVAVHSSYCVPGDTSVPATVVSSVFHRL